MIDYAKKSLTGVWVGDCIGNLGQLYFVHDILKALESGMIKFGGQLDRFNQQFVYSDDTEEAIVLYNHLKNSHRTHWQWSLPLVTWTVTLMEKSMGYNILYVWEQQWKEWHRNKSTPLPSKYFMGKGTI
jgi:hypothetical protein